MGGAGLVYTLPKTCVAAIIPSPMIPLDTSTWSVFWRWIAQLRWSGRDTSEIFTALGTLVKPGSHCGYRDILQNMSTQALRFVFSLSPFTSFFLEW